MEAELNCQQMSLDDFVAYATELKNHGTSADVLQQFRELHARAAVLASMKIGVKGNVSELTQFPFELVFSQTNLNGSTEEIGKERGFNLVGNVEMTIRRC